MQSCGPPGIEFETNALCSTAAQAESRVQASVEDSKPSFVYH